MCPAEFKFTPMCFCDRDSAFTSLKKIVVSLLVQSVFLFLPLKLYVSLLADLGVYFRLCWHILSVLNDTLLPDILLPRSMR